MIREKLIQPSQERSPPLSSSSGQDLFVKVYRYELGLGIIILFVSRHIAPFLTKRSLGILPMSIWRYYHAFKIFSTGSTYGPAGAGFFGDPLQPMVSRSPFDLLFPNYSLYIAF